MNSTKRTLRWLSLIILSLTMLAACTPKETAPEGEGELLETERIPDERRFVFVPGSKFIMGSTKDEPLARDDEYPQHEVVLTSFFIMKREVTNSEYQACIDASACTAPLVEDEGPTALFYDPEYINWPVVGVDWYQAQEFCEWTDGRLPTEAEWEKAARGKEGYTYPWGDDAPTCDLANGAGCVKEADTTRVLSYPGGESPYKLAGTAGNVREWTADWYAQNTYTELVTTNPVGPTDGETKVTRGGSYDDGPENLRTAARMPLDPHEQSPIVGFRCVPAGEPMAPICQPTYRNFCDDPRIPRKPGDEPCVPEEQKGDCGGTSIANFGCPDGDLVTVTFATPATGNVDVTVGTDGFNCETGDGVIYCTGPAQQMGTNVAVTVCGAPPDGIMPAETGTVTAEMNLSAILMAGTLNEMLASISQGEALDSFGFCPDGYVIDAETGDCMVDERKPCPDGWYMTDQTLETIDETVILCVPENEESCPEGTEYSQDLIGCTPVDQVLGCPTGFQTGAPGERCAPPLRRTEPCLPGYWMDTELGCCVPFEGECETGEYLETRVDECMGLESGGCPVCTIWDAYEGCIPIPDCDPGTSTGGTNPNMGSVAFNDDCLPQDTGMDGECNPPEGDGDCGEDYFMTRDPASGEEICKPTYGPGSGCPRGTIVDTRTECCVPLSNPCSDEGGSSADGFETGVPGGNDNPFYNTQFGTTNPLFGVVFGDGDFNPYGSDCENAGDSDPGCPPGAYRNDDGGCEFESGGSTPACPEGCAQDYEETNVCNCEQDGNFTCPEGDCWLMDTGLATCTWTCGGDGDTNPCDSDDQVWITELELCLPRGDDCCPPGYDYSLEYEGCMPIIQQGYTQTTVGTENVTETGTVTGTECADGYEYVDGRCVLISRRGSERCCWTTIVNVPRCVGPCKVGKVFNTGTGRCEDLVRQGKCSDCKNMSCCTGSCWWDTGTNTCQG